MGPVKLIQQLQLGLLEAAYVNENCAADLACFLQELPEDESRSIAGMITLLQTEAEKLKKLSKEVVASQYFIFPY